MNEQIDQEGLTTADMAAAADRGGTESMMEAERASMPPKPMPAQDFHRDSSPLFPESDSQTFRDRWSLIQTGFVDEPRRAVEQADSLVADVMKRLAQTFADERKKLEEQWSRGDNISTEDLRVSLQRYRSFFDRLLSV